MQRTTLSILIPPLAVCRYGCAGCCAAPIGVFWLAGITSIVYGYLGGPAGLETGVQIDVDNPPTGGPIPPGNYRYVLIFSPLGGENDGPEVDSLEVLP